MRRRTFFGCLLVLGLATIGAETARAQERVDRVEFFDHTKNHQKTFRTGTIATEDPAKLVILTGARMTPLEIPATDVIDVTYDKEPTELAELRSAERQKERDPGKLIERYREVLKKMPADQKFARAQLRFKLVKLLAAQGDDRTSPVALEELRNFAKEFPDSRQILECLALLGQVLLAGGQSPAEVQGALRRIQSKYGSASKDLSTRCNLLAARLLMQEGELHLKSNPDVGKKKYAEAHGRLQPLVKGTGGIDVRLGLAECNTVLGKLPEAMKDLDALLADAANHRTRAAIHVGRGDCFRLAGQLRDAMWEYLWVDVIYNEDRDQAARALYYLAEVFEAQNDSARAKECRDRLATDPQFRETRYVRMLPKM